MCNCSKEHKKPKHSDEVLHLGVIHGSGPNRTRDRTRPDCSRSDRTELDDEHGTGKDWTAPDRTGPHRTGRRHRTRPDHSPLLFWDLPSRIHVLVYVGLHFFEDPLTCRLRRTRHLSKTRILHGRCQKSESRHVTNMNSKWEVPKKQRVHLSKPHNCSKTNNIFRLDNVKVCNCSNKNPNSNNLQKFSTLA